MSFIALLNPINMVAEKKKFLLDPSYNPQLSYDENIDKDELYKYGFPNDEYVTLAEKIVKISYKDKTDDELQAEKGMELSKEEVETKLKLFLKMHGLEKRYGIIWSRSFLARTAINATTIKLRLPVSFREEDLLGMLYHEIGTHAIRRINYEQQPWYKKKKKYGFSSHLQTEEGLAVLHSLLPLKNKLAHSSALRYLAVAKAQEMGFVKLYQFLNKYIKDPDRCFNATLRLKRGISDTAKGGGYTKDLVYFEGLVDVWRYLRHHDFEIDHLYFGRLAMEDTEKAREMNSEFKPLLPSFYVTNKEKYKQEMLKIGQANMLDKLQS
ncbi:MAG: DUF1704 domain-containing protein [Candidatus Pacebacteria bacterium]|nr:DUF1704 domain-containing protein [Candidatus Paceibacterota bacterium]